MRNAEELGHETHLVCEVAGSLFTIRHDPLDPVPPVGDEVELHLDEAHLLRFDHAGARVR